MFFKQKPKQPIIKAISLIDEAIEIAYKYKRDKSYIPTTAELKLLEELEQKLLDRHSTAQYIVRCLKQRFNGEPEGAAKFHNDEVFNYHYPSK